MQALLPGRRYRADATIHSKGAIHYRTAIQRRTNGIGSDQWTVLHLPDADGCTIPVVLPPRVWRNRYLQEYLDMLPRPAAIKYWTWVDAGVYQPTKEERQAILAAQRADGFDPRCAKAITTAYIRAKNMRPLSEVAGIDAKDGASARAISEARGRKAEGEGNAGLRGVRDSADELQRRR